MACVFLEGLFLAFACDAVFAAFTAFDALAAVGALAGGFFQSIGAFQAAYEMVVFVAKHGFAVISTTKAVVSQVLDFHVAVFVRPKGNIFCVFGPI